MPDVYTPQILSAPLNPIASDGGPSQSIWEWGDAQVEVGLWECGPGTIEVPPGDFDEMMCMAAGRATVTQNGADFDLTPATLWVAPRGVSHSWTVHQTVRKLYVIDHRSGEMAETGFMSNPHVATVGNTKPRAATSGDPHESTNVLWAHNRLDVGVWECTPGVFAASRIGYDEVFMCLSGAATMTASNGMSFDLSPGSVLYTPSGFTGTWDVSETFRKVYCLILDR